MCFFCFWTMTCWNWVRSSKKEALFELGTEFAKLEKLSSSLLFDCSSMTCWALAKTESWKSSPTKIGENPLLSLSATLQNRALDMSCARLRYLVNDRLHSSVTGRWQLRDSDKGVVSDTMPNWKVLDECVEILCGKSSGSVLCPM